MGVPMEGPAFVSAVQELLEQVQESLLASATAFRDDNIVDVTSYEELKAVVAEGEQGPLAAAGGEARVGGGSGQQKT
jgi:prolyl-tRNA synthetase